MRTWTVRIRTRRTDGAGTRARARADGMMDDRWCDAMDTRVRHAYTRAINATTRIQMTARAYHADIRTRRVRTRGTDPRARRARGRHARSRSCKFALRQIREYGIYAYHAYAHERTRIRDKYARDMTAYGNGTATAHRATRIRQHSPRYLTHTSRHHTHIANLPTITFAEIPHAPRHAPRIPRARHAVLRAYRAGTRHGSTRAPRAHTRITRARTRIRLRVHANGPRRFSTRGRAPARSRHAHRTVSDMIAIYGHTHQMRWTARYLACARLRFLA